MIEIKKKSYSLDLATSLQLRRSGQESVQTILLLGLLANCRALLTHPTVLARNSSILFVRVAVHGNGAHDAPIVLIFMLYFIVVDNLLRAQRYPFLSRNRPVLVVRLALLIAAHFGLLQH